MSIKVYHRVCEYAHRLVHLQKCSYSKSDFIIIFTILLLFNQNFQIYILIDHNILKIFYAILLRKLPSPAKIQTSVF